MSAAFPTSVRVYMDANATTPLLPEVIEAMRPYWMEHFGNASSIHLHGQQARTAVDRARETMAEFFNCHDAEVVFNSGGTEGDNTALFGLLHPGDHFITTSIEHSAIMEGCQSDGAIRRGNNFCSAPAQRPHRPDGHPARHPPPDPLISVMLANNETGVRSPLRKSAKSPPTPAFSSTSTRSRARAR
jgi:cysteine desulfurase